MVDVEVAGSRSILKWKSIQKIGAINDFLIFTTQIQTDTGCEANGCLRLGHYPRLKLNINRFKAEFTIVIFIQYKPRIAVAILDL